MTNDSIYKECLSKSTNIFIFSTQFQIFDISYKKFWLFSEHCERSEAEHQVAREDAQGREDGGDSDVGEQRRPHLQEQLVHLEEQLVPEPVAGRREGGLRSAWPE